MDKIEIAKKKYKGFVVKTDFGIGKTKDGDRLKKGGVPIYLTDTEIVYVVPNEIEILSFYE